MTNTKTIETNSLELVVSKLLNIHKTLEKLNSIPNSMNIVIDKLTTISDSLDKIITTIFGLKKTKTLSKDTSFLNTHLLPNEKIASLSINNILPTNLNPPDTLYTLVEKIYTSIKNKSGLGNTIGGSVLGVTIGFATEKVLKHFFSNNKDKMSGGMGNSQDKMSGGMGNSQDKMSGGMGKFKDKMSGGMGKFKDKMSGGMGKFKDTLMGLSRSLGVFFKLNPFIGIGLGVVALGVGLYLLIENWDKISFAVQNFGATVQQVFSTLYQKFGVLGIVTLTLITGLGLYVFWMKTSIVVQGFFGAMMTATSTIATSFGIAMAFVNKILLANPIILIVAGVIALIAGLVLLVIHWDTVKNTIINFGVTAWEWINKIADIFGILIPPIFFLRMGIQHIINIWKFFQGMFGAFKIGGVEGAINYLIEAFHQGIENIKSMFSQLFSAEFWLGMFENVKNWFFSLGEWIGKIWEKITKFDFKGITNTPLEDAIPKNPEVDIQPNLLPLNGTKALNNTVDQKVIPIEHTNFLAKNGLLDQGVQSTIPSLVPNAVPNAGTVIRNKTAKISFNDKGKNSPVNKNTVINIAHMEISDVSNLDDFVRELSFRVTT